MNTFIRPSMDNQQTERQTDRQIYTDKNSTNLQVKNVRHTYKTIKTQNHETTYEFTYNSKLSLTSLTARDFCLKTD